MTWSFRLHFLLSKNQRLAAGDGAYEEVLSSGDGVVVVRTIRLGSVAEPVDSIFELPREPISGAEHLALHGAGYPTEEDAEAAARRWQARFCTALASLRVGADFGTRAVGGLFIARHGEAWYRRRAGLSDDDQRRVFGDHLGTRVFESESKPLFVDSTAELVGVAPVDELVRAVEILVDSGYLAPEKHQLAYDMWGASHFSESPDARFLMRMVALETLIEQESRSDRVRRHIEDVIERTRQADLDEEEKQSLVSSLGGLKRESITQAGKRVARILTPRTYAGEDPDTFFVRCYSLRSALVHGQSDRPPAREVATRGEQLRQFVADLLSGPLLHDIGGVVHPSVVAFTEQQVPGPGPEPPPAS